jgi:hypothetical protein
MEMLGRRFSPRGWLSSGFALGLPLITATWAAACPLCYEAARQMETTGQQLDRADQVVLAAPVAGKSDFRIVEAVKGKHAPGDIIADAVTGRDAAAVACDPCLLLRDPLTSWWTSLGAVGAEHADWLRQLAATRLVEGDRPRPTWPVTVRAPIELSYAGWRQRIALVLPYLENPEPLVARIAWGELARAPYATMDVAKSWKGAAEVQRWLDDPKLASRHPAYILLLGFTGGSADAARLEERLESAWNTHRATNLAAMIGADLELRGPYGVDWVEAKYFADRSRTMPEIEAALNALTVHGDANGTVPRDRVIQAFHAFIKARPPMAGFVAPQLADWNYWDATADYEALLKGKALKDPASEFAVVNYLRRAASAKAALQ